MKAGTVLIVPACERGRGGGHLSRSLLLFHSLKVWGFDSYLWIPEHLKDDFLQRFKEFFQSFNDRCFLSRKEELDDFFFDLIILDRYKTSIKEFAFWTALSKRALSKRSLPGGRTPLIGIDEGGLCRKRFDFLIDLLPNLQGHDPNICAPKLLPLPKNRRPINSPSAKDGLIRILISFGAEDYYGLGISVARKLSRLYVKSSQNKKPEITLIAPIPPHDSSGKLLEFAGINVIGKIPNLREHLAKYDLFITHFGLGAFEAVYARLPVLLASPTAYHERLSRKAGFISLNHEPHELVQTDFLKTLEGRSFEIARRYGLEEDQKEDFSSFIAGLAPLLPRVCPVCESDAGLALPVLARLAESSWRRCSRCGTIYQFRLKAPSIEYGEDYFFGSYKKQYGKTYLEDFPNLMEISRKRLINIKALLDYFHTKAQRRKEGRSKKEEIKNLPPNLGVFASLRDMNEKITLLDVGCAYGPFLAAAAKAGFSPTGIEPVKEAASYVREKLGFSCWQGFFSAALPEDLRGSKGAPFDAVTLWYVIEHFEALGEILREIHSLLKDGGVLAFSTPSFSGISGRKSLGSFLKNSPTDHWTILKPSLCRRILKQYGFSLRKIVITGHHPERFPFLGRFARPDKQGLLYRFLLLISRLFRLGDTFEVYGVKVGK